MKYRVILLALIVMGVAPAPAQVTPPELMNYQGVLRDAAGVPLQGDIDMVFRFYSAADGGDEILEDRHTTADSVPVTVTTGLFSVQLGGGAVADGWGPGTYTSLAEVFRDHAEVWLALQVGIENLEPKIRIASTGYALNASHLAGKKDGDFLDTSGTAQAKAGPLTLGSTLTLPDPGDLITNRQLDFGNGYGFYSDGTSNHPSAAHRVWLDGPDLGELVLGPRTGASYLANMRLRSSEISLESAVGTPLKVASGNVGIWEPSPSYPLDVAGSVRISDWEVGGGDTFAHAFLAFAERGISAYGKAGGGYFQDQTSLSRAHVAYGTSGIEASGYEIGGYFYDTDDSGRAYLGRGDVGIQAYGDSHAGSFSGDVLVTGDLRLEPSSGGVTFPDGSIQATAATDCLGGRTPIDSAPITIDTPGAYVVTRNLTVSTSWVIRVTASDVEIDLNGYVLTGNDEVIRATGVGGLAVRNGTIISSEDTTGAIYIDASTTPIRGVVLERLTITADSGMGIYLQGSTGGFEDFAIRDCTLRTNLQSIHIELGSSGAVEHNSIRSDYATGMDLSGVNATRVVGNTVTQCFSDGIFVTGNNNLIRDNISADNGWIGLAVGGDYNNVERNLLNENESWGLALSTSANGNVFGRNTVRFNGGSTSCAENPVGCSSSDVCVAGTGNSSFGDNMGPDPGC